MTSSKVGEGGVTKSSQGGAGGGGSEKGDVIYEQPLTVTIKFIYILTVQCSTLHTH